MIRFELHTPDGSVRTINEHHLKEAFNKAAGDFDTKAPYRIGLVDHYRTMIEEKVMPLMDKGTKLYVVIKSKANEVIEKAHG